MTDFVVAIDTSRLDAKLRRVPRLVEASVLRAVKRLAIDLQGYVKAQKLTGQVLHVRTGNLRRSINQEVTQDGSVIRGIVGTNVEYARLHEYGFQGAVDVKAHLRRTAAQIRRATYMVTDRYGNQTTKIRQTGKFGKSTGETEVRAFTRYVNLPERSFLRSALKDFEPKILENLRRAASGEALL